MAADNDNLSIEDADGGHRVSDNLKDSDVQILLAEDNPQESSEQLKQSLRAYVIVSQLSFVVITPLLLFIGGGTWLVRRLDLPSWLSIVSIFIGIIVMICALISYLFNLISIYDKDGGKKDKYRKYKTDPKDYDY